MTLSSEPHRTHIEEAPIAVFEMNSDGEYVNVNESACEVVGYSEDELLDMSISDLFPESDNSEENPVFTDLNETGQTRYEGEILPKDSKQIDVIVEGVALDDDQFIINIQNISDQVQYERELHKVKNRFQTLFEKAPEEIAIHDSSGNIFDVNQREIDNLGYTRDELTSMNVADFQADYSRDELQTMWEQVDIDEMTKVEGKHERKDGSTYPVEVWINKAEIVGDVRFLAFVRDITERKERERQLQREKEQLDNFARTISHDLRNPLHVAQGRIELAQKECDCEHLEYAADGIERSLDLIEDLLAMARGGQQISEIESVDVSELVKTCWNTVNAADATLVSDIELTIAADRTRLRQLIENLLHNAEAYGGEDVTIKVGSLPDGFYVADDGPGIPENEREDVFEPGYSENSGGTGFGLAIVQQIVEAHEWDINLTDGPDGGARFEITEVDVVAE